MIIPLVCILQYSTWRSTRKQDWHAFTYAVVYSSCHHNVQYGSFKLVFRVAVFCIVLFNYFFLFCRRLHEIVLKCVSHVLLNVLS